MIVELNGLSINIIRKRIKTMTLRIYPPDGLIKVSAPIQLSQSKIMQFLHEKNDWIQIQHQRIKQQHAAINSDELTTGSSIPFKGKQYLLIVEAHHGPKQIVIKDELIYCYIHPHSTKEERVKLFDGWYKQEMALVIPSRIAYWQEIIPVQVAQWGIRTMRTRWGSCNTRAHRISLNLSLIKKKPECLDYVLVHELVHLLEPSHNQRFYTLMTQFMPQWRDIQRLLEGKG